MLTTNHVSIGTIVRLAGMTALAVIVAQAPVEAADHNDSPAAKDDPAADLADLYAWHTEGGRLVLAATFSGLSEAGMPATYDDGMLYGFHIDRDADDASDHDIWIRFGQNSAGDWGVQVTGMPQSTDPVVGAVDEVLSSEAGEMVFAGPREDPFFFDLEGFKTTLDSGTVSFDSSRDSFAGTNVTAIVLEMDAAAAADGSDNLSIWVTTRRKG